MIATIHQPDNLPYFGFFHKVKNSDVFIVLDNVQFKKNNFQNRNRIYTKQGLFWLTVPVYIKGHITSTISDIEIVENWKEKYSKTVLFTYKNAPYFADIEGIYDYIINFEGTSLLNFNLGAIKLVLKILGINTPIVLASEVNSKNKKTELLIDLINHVKANQYLAGKGGFEYMDLDLFKINDIDLIAHNFDHPSYVPFNFSDFGDYPSIIDVIANLGIASVRELLENG
jgi:hypothetical protein